ncbi:MAG: IS1634 family transposase [Candidatus Lokiarchaeota archaeon]|nr:IS1634 family transposase [Candidatus Lokiarchaeota archaeon]
MVFIERKKKKGRVYLYLTHKARINGKSKRVWTIYLGPEDRIMEHVEQIKQNLKLEFDIDTFDFGRPISLLRIAEKLDLINIIDETVKKREQGLSVGEYILIAVLNRCIQPTSKNQIRKWFHSTYLQKHFPKIETYLDSMAYTNHYQYLTQEAIDAIEEKINKKLVVEFQVQMDELMYDPTNFATFINPKEQTLPRHGHSKEGRHILNLVSLSLFCTRDGGVPVMHRVYPGNIQDAAHFKEDFPRFLTRLRELNITPTEITLIFDKGNISPDVFEEIDSSNMKWIASVRPSSHKDLKKIPADDFEMSKLPNGKEIGVLEFQRKLHGRSRRLLVVYNPNRAHWARENLVRKLNKKIEKVKEWFENRLNERRWRDPKNVEKKIKNLIESKSHLQYISYKVSGTYGAVRYTINIDRTNLDNHIKTLGKSFLMTNHSDKGPIEIVWLYRQQYTVEHAFRYLKNPDIIKLTPMYVWKDDCIRGYVFTCVLALLLLTLLCREVNTKYPEVSLPFILAHLSEVEAAQITFSGSNKIQQKLVNMSADAKKLVDFLKLKQAL